MLAEILHATPHLETAIGRFMVRRRPRVNWVQHQSRAVGEISRLPPGLRNAALRESGKSAFYERFQPRIALPRGPDFNLSRGTNMTTIVAEEEQAVPSWPAAVAEVGSVSAS